MDQHEKTGNLADLLEEETHPTMMTFRYPDTSSESETGSESDDEMAEAGTAIKDEVHPKEEEAKAEEEDDGIDVEAYLIKALESKILIKKPMRPLKEYISPNRSPKRKSPPSTPPLPANDLRWLINAQKKKEQDRKIYEQMKEARQRLYEKELEREQEKERLEKRLQFLARAKKSKKQTPKTTMTPPAMVGICGCRDRCEWRGICQNLFKNKGNTNKSQGENQNNTI